MLAAALFGAALVYVSLLAFRSATVYYLTVGELYAHGETRPGKLVRVAGSLVPDTFRRGGDPLDVSFTLRDDAGNTMPVKYRGEVGQLFFNENSELILEGRFEAGTFDTETLIVKCPSKYVNGNDNGGADEYTAETFGPS